MTQSLPTSFPKGEKSLLETRNQGGRDLALTKWGGKMEKRALYSSNPLHDENGGSAAEIEREVKKGAVRRRLFPLY